MMKDLSYAMNIFTREEIKDQFAKKGQSVKLIDMETVSGATEAIRKLLFEHPLYEGCAENSENIDILVVGAGTYAQKFMDIAFELSQVKNCNINITAVSNNADLNKEQYLKIRPAFTKFFAVNNLCMSNEPFGNLKFMSVFDNGEKLSFIRNNKILNKKIIDRIILKNNKSRFSYIFIALGDDQLNSEVAECFYEHDLLARKENIYFICYNNKNKKTYIDGITPIYINDAISRTDYYENLERMTLNAHRLWDSSLNIDIKKYKNDFKKQSYNHDSSMSNVLSIKYKLHSIGIDNFSEYDKAAELFMQKCDKHPEIIDMLAKYEHRRWVANYVCNGWDVLTDYSALTSDTKDKKRKLHPCLVPSREGLYLNNTEWTDNNKKKWDTAKKTDLEKLDALDRLSVELHQYFVKRAAEVKNESSIHTHINKIRNNLESQPNILQYFDKLILCMNEIIEGKRNQANLYTTYLKDFKKQLSSLENNESCGISKNVLSEVSSTFKIIENTFFPILQSIKYVNYKKYDYDLVKEIPFIITYMTNMQLYIPFNMEMNGICNNNILFANIASVIALNPASVTYVVDTDDIDKDKLNFEKSLKYALRCIDKRKLQSRINLLFIQSNKNNIIDIEYKENIKNISEKIFNIKIIEYDNDTLLKNQIVAHIRNRIKNKKQITLVERNSSGISKLMRGLGCYDELPAYSYDSLNCKFETDEKCKFLNYIKIRDYLRVSDMFEFQNAKNGSNIPEMQQDYEFFWNLYKTTDNDTYYNKEKRWKLLCGYLAANAEHNDIIGSLKINRLGQNKTKQKYYIPAFCRGSIEKVINELKKYGVNIVEKNNFITYYNSSTYKIELNTYENVHKYFEKLISNPYILSDPLKIIIKKVYNDIIICFDDLKVTNLEIPNNNDAKEIINILGILYDRKYIVDYKNEQKSDKFIISFTYSSNNIKRLMTNEGQILELYVYYKVMEQNYFDDIVIGCEVIWDHDNIENEFDLILTKNFRTFFVECKAKKCLDQNIYYKLAQLTQQFGINAAPILVADTLEVPKLDNSSNELQRKRGENLGVITLYTKEQIVESAPDFGIGISLRKLMEGIQ